MRERVDLDVAHLLDAAQPLRALLEHGASVDARDAWGGTCGHLAAARGHTRDFGPARSFATQYRPWLLAGAAGTLMASPTVPFMLFVSARIVTKLDQNADWLLAWCEGRLRWSPWQAGQRKLAAWARAVKAELRARMTM